jgi:hypothetical protein
MVSELRRYVRFTTDLWRFLGREFPAEAAAELLRAQLREREASFLDVLRRAVYARPDSPYRRLLLHVGAEHGDVAALVAERGLEGALAHLDGLGVGLTQAEFKGRVPIVRPGGLELQARDEDFDNPVLRRGYTLLGGGSTGAPRRTIVDFGHYVAQAAYQRVFLDAFGLEGRPLVIWRPAPPARSAFGNALRALRLGMPVEWYSHNRIGIRDVEPRDWLALRTAVVATRLRPPALSLPAHVPLSQAEVVARRLGDLVAAGTPGLLDTTAGSGVRAAHAAAREGIDLTGTFFRVGGEPLTPGKAAAIGRVGARVVCNYSMSELGRVGMPCAGETQAPDDVHVLLGKVGLLLRPAAGRADGAQALVLTTVLPTAAKLLLNVESGDTGTLVQRDCGCPLGALGYRLHLHGIRSYEKLTSEGTNFRGPDVLRLVEEVLPARFGGGPTDYQLVEDEVDGLPRLRLLVSRRVGSVDENAVLDAALATLAEGPAYRRMMVDLWRDGSTLGVERGEPFETDAAKIPALYVLSRASPRST